MIKCKIINGKKQCQVFNKTGTKPLSKPGMSKGAAVKRLKQVEYFKNKNR